MITGLLYNFGVAITLQVRSGELDCHCILIVILMCGSINSVLFYHSVSKRVYQQSDKTIRLSSNKSKCLDISNYGTDDGTSVW